MKSKLLIRHSKEKFIAPRVTQILDFELGDDLLLGESKVTQMAPVETMGQEVVDNGASYYEGSWY